MIYYFMAFILASHRNKADTSKNIWYTDQVHQSFNKW